MSTQVRSPSAEFPAVSPLLKRFGLKFSAGGAHISRTIMSAELGAVLSAVPQGASSGEYRDAILERNVLTKTTHSTRRKSLRHLRELYGLDPETPLFRLMLKLYALDPASLIQLAVQVAWSRDPIFRATTTVVLEASEGDLVPPSVLAAAVDAAFPGQYSESSLDAIARHAASSWAQTGHLIGRTGKTRRRLQPSPAAVTMALFLGNIAGFHGAAVFSNPWCRLLDLDFSRARALGQEAHRAGLLDLRAVGEVVELTFPQLAEFQEFQYEPY